MERRVAVRGIAYKNGQILAVKHKEHTGGESSFWATPGGGIDPNESLLACLEREMIEETGIKPIIGKLLFIQQFAVEYNGAMQEQMEFFFHIANPEDYTVVDLASTTHGVHELARCEFIDPKTEYILPEFLQTIDIQNYIENDLPVLVKNYLPN